jgi:hypothetical protein
MHLALSVLGTFKHVSAGLIYYTIVYVTQVKLGEMSTVTRLRTIGPVFYLRALSLGEQVYRLPKTLSVLMYAFSLRSK